MKRFLTCCLLAATLAWFGCAENPSKGNAGSNSGTDSTSVTEGPVPMTHILICCRSANEGVIKFKVGDKWITDHDYKNIDQARAILSTIQQVGINNVIIDADARTVYLADPEMSLDVGSVGKGYAVEMVCQAAEARGLTSALVSVGGNLRAIGVKPDGSQWTGGVENPWSSSDVYTSDSMLGGAINMSDMALVTSGDYQRYYVVDGKRYHHLIDPDTLFPAAYFNGVTVLCSDSGLADCLTTGLFCQPLEDGMKIVESLDGVEAMWCTPDQQVITSSGWDSHLKKCKSFGN